MEIDARMVDAHVGRRIAEARIKKGLDRGEIGKNVGVSYQQIQKYENGSNRVSCSRLYMIALCLESPIEYFFEGLPSPDRTEVQTTGRRKSPARLRLEELALAPIGTSTRFSFGTFASPRAALSLVNKVGRPGWAEIKTTATGTTIKKIGIP